MVKIISGLICLWRKRDMLDVSWNTSYIPNLLCLDNSRLKQNQGQTPFIQPDLITHRAALHGHGYNYDALAVFQLLLFLYKHCIYTMPGNTRIVICFHFFNPEVNCLLSGSFSENSPHPLRIIDFLLFFFNNFSKYNKVHQST